MVGLLCKVKSQGSFWWVLYASPIMRSHLCALEGGGALEIYNK